MRWTWLVLAVMACSGDDAVDDGVDTDSGSDTDTDSTPGPSCPTEPSVTIGTGLFTAIEFADEQAAGFSFQSDTLNIIPTPASAALLGLGGLVAVRRRR